MTFTQQEYLENIEDAVRRGMKNRVVEIFIDNYKKDKYDTKALSTLLTNIMASSEIQSLARGGSDNVEKKQRIDFKKKKHSP